MNDRETIIFALGVFTGLILSATCFAINVIVALLQGLGMF